MMIIMKAMALDGLRKKERENIFESVEVKVKVAKL